MKIIILEDGAEVAGSQWKKGTLLEAPVKAAKEAVAAKLATDDPEAIAKAQAAARKRADAAKDKKFDPEAEAKAKAEAEAKAKAEAEAKAKAEAEAKAKKAKSQSTDK
jgi:membrane protein involved in colicin uptake